MVKELLYDALYYTVNGIAYGFLATVILFPPVAYVVLSLYGEVTL